MNTQSSSSDSHQPHADTGLDAVRCAVLTVSDTRIPDTDKSGQLIQTQLTAAGHEISHYQIVKDEPAQISTLVQNLVHQSAVQAILPNGGTDITAVIVTVGVPFLR
ncbi:MAG: molybdopterin-binding protein [Cyanobacteria bacterium J06623_5]